MLCFSCYECVVSKMIKIVKFIYKKSMKKYRRIYCKFIYIYKFPATANEKIWTEYLTFRFS